MGVRRTDSGENGGKAPQGASGLWVQVVVFRQQYPFTAKIMQRFYTLFCFFLHTVYVMAQTKIKVRLKQRFRNKSMSARRPMLVVDNNEDLCRSAVSVLKEIGVDAEWALDGRTALKMVENRHREHQDYEIVLLQHQFPSTQKPHCGKGLRYYPLQAYSMPAISYLLPALSPFPNPVQYGTRFPFPARFLALSYRRKMYTAIA